MTMRISPLTTSYQPRMQAAAPASQDKPKEPSAMKRAWQAVKGVFGKQKSEKTPLAKQSSLSDYGAVSKK